VTNRPRCSGSRALGILLPVLLVVTGGCGGGDGEGEVGSGGRRATTTVPQFFPLTGLQVTEAASAGRSAATVKIENHPASRPQAGLDLADVVFEAVVEGGQTRFLAVFHSTDADVGPVRSVRPSDPAIVSAFGGIVAYSGGIPRFVEAMRATGLKNFTENDTDVLRRPRARAAPHNLYTSTRALYDKAGSGSPPPKFAEFLKPGEAFAPPGATPVSNLTLNVGQSTRISYDWDAGSGTWKRSLDGRAHTAESGTQIAPTTVIVQFVAYRGSGEVDTTGAAVTEAQVVGSGEAAIFAGGMMLNARWSKSSAKAMTTWTDAGGAPISLPAGRTWVELPAPGTPLATR
jgi:hypothetical protein